MANENVKELEKNRYELTLTIPKADFDKAVMTAYKKNVGKITVPGFRKGKAPKAIIEKMYGASFFYDDALDAVLPDIYAAAVKASELDVVSRPELEIVSIDDNGVVLSAKVYTRPVAAIKNYKGLAAEKVEATVCDHEIDAEIEKTRKRNSRMLTVEGRAAENGDTAVIDFEGFRDGVAFEGGKGEKYSLTLGSHSFIPGFEEAIVGHSAGEEFDITVTFPEDYGEPTLAGKETVFKIKIHELKKEELPEVNDDFVKEVSETLNTVDEYRADIASKITERKQKADDKAFEEKVLDALLAETEVEIPACMIDEEVDNDINDYDYKLRSQGGNLEMYLQYTGQTEENLRKTLRNGAERRVKVRLAVDAVAKAEGIVATAEEIEAEFEKFATAYSMKVEEIKAKVPEKNISDDIAFRKALDFVKDNAAVTIVKEEHNHED